MLSARDEVIVKKTEHLRGEDFNLCCGSLIKTMRKAAFAFSLL